MNAKTLSEQIVAAHERANAARITSEELDARAATLRAECASLRAQHAVISRRAELARAEATVSAADAAVVRAQVQVNRVERSTKQATDKVSLAEQALKLAENASAVAAQASKQVSNKQKSKAEEDETLIAQAEAESLHSVADAAHAESKVATANADIETSHLRIARAELDAAKAKAAYARAAAVVFKLQLDAAIVESESGTESTATLPVVTEKKEAVSEVSGDGSRAGRCGDDGSVASPGSSDITPETPMETPDFKQAVQLEIAKSKTVSTTTDAGAHNTTTNTTTRTNSTATKPKPKPKPSGTKANSKKVNPFSLSAKQSPESNSHGSAKSKAKKLAGVGGNGGTTRPKPKQSGAPSQNAITNSTEKPGMKTPSTPLAAAAPASAKGRTYGNPFQQGGKQARGKPVRKEQVRNTFDPPSAHRTHYNALQTKSLDNRTRKPVVQRRAASGLNAAANEFVPGTWSSSGNNHTPKAKMETSRVNAFAPRNPNITFAQQSYAFPPPPPPLYYGAMM